MEQILILSGAGLSQESGIKTFRDSDGLWENYSIDEVCSVDGFMRDREKVLNFYDKRRDDLKNKEPNLAHKILAELKKKYPDRISIVTQNVDDLLERAGCPDVIHLHGTLVDIRCEDCGEVFYIGYESQKDKICPKCNSKFIRHNVVMFGESAPMYKVLDEIIQNSTMFIVIGTSGVVLPIAWIASFFENSILNNFDEDVRLDSAFKKVLHKRATEVILEIRDEIEKFLNPTS